MKDKEREQETVADASNHEVCCLCRRGKEREVGSTAKL